jgi:hypothetical protein
MQNEIGITQEKPSLSRGRRRMLELAAAAEVERLAEERRLLADFGAEPSAGQRLLIEQAAHLAVRGRRLRAQGRGQAADDVARLLTRVLIKLGVRNGSDRPRKSFADRLADRLAKENAGTANGGSNA